MFLNFDSSPVGFIRAGGTTSLDALNQNLVVGINTLMMYGHNKKTQVKKPKRT